MHPELESTQSKLANDAPPLPRNNTPVFHGRWTRVPPIRVELKLCLMPNLRGEGFVPGNVQVRTPGNFVGINSLAGFYVSQNASIRHGGNWAG